MRSTVMIRSSFIAASAVLLLAAAGCGGNDNKTCSDACNTLFSCASKLGFTPSNYLGPAYDTLSDCISHCNSSTCANTQQLVNCGAGVQCNSLTQVQNDVTACFVNSGCQP